MNKRVHAVALMALAWTLGGCQQADESEHQTVVGTPTIDQLMDHYLDASLQLQPGSALFFDDSRFNDRYSEYDETTEAAVRQLTRDTLAQLARIDPTTLSDDERISYDYLKFDLNTAQRGEAFPEAEMPINQFYNELNFFAQLGSGESAQPFRNAQDYDNFLRKIDGFVRRCDQLIVWLQKGVKHGVVLPTVLAERVTPQLQAHIVDNATDSLFYKPVAQFPEAIGATDQVRLRKAYVDAITTKIVPSYQKLLDFWRRDYLPHTRASHGYGALPNGQAWYQFQIVRNTTLSDKTAEQIHQIGLDEVARIHADMQKIRAELNIKGDLSALFQFMKTDPSLYFSDAEQALQAYRDIKLKIDAQLPQYFDVTPRSPYEVRRVEAFREASASSAEYQAGSADGSRPGIFYVNLADIKLQPRYGVTTLSLHEAAPGHHFQIMLAIEAKDLPKYRRYGGNTAYNEGWALYAESLGYPMQLFDDPIQRYGNLSDELLRAMRLVVDTGLHAKGWTREQAIAYMSLNSSMPDADIRSEVERYMAIPGQALGYKMGQLQILSLRALAQQQLADRFDLKAFHREVLRIGPVPLDVLRAHVERWIAKQKTD